MAKESGSASISLKEGTDIAKVVLMPGDPLRAKYVAESFLEQPVLFNDVRNMLGYTGIYKGKRISVMGHGMGIPSMGIYSHELYTQFGVESIIRIGSAGALSPELHTKDVVIAMGASTNSAYVDAYGFYGHIAPLADYGMLANAVKSAGELKIPVKVGSVYSSDF
ncbi:MAG: purine-nucleoside phosphorylase, partial [Lachnospiraceae bacterium]|nr:purine-nucleoside phosphorylase [Lachnospiraceae bacterium]